MNLEDFFQWQLREWDLARNNYESLKEVRIKPFTVGTFHGFVQYNPSRAGSTNAKTDKKSIEKRTCFLCNNNRPITQISEEIIPGWEILVNPYPIFPKHFTIASKEHEKQNFDLKTAKILAKKLPDMVVFYNDDGAGASAPDHAHYQAVPKEYLPLIKQVDSVIDTDSKNLKDFLSQLPFKVVSFQTISFDLKVSHPFNAFLWQNNDGEIITVYIPRSKHRPDCFYKEPPFRRAISPGAVDMAGVIITPYENDFNQLSDKEIEEIYSQVAIPNEKRG